MDLQARILRSISDNKPVLFHSEQNIPLKRLIEEYNKHVHVSDDLYIITAHTSGLNFKIALSRLDPEVELDLLKIYVDEQRAIKHGIPLKESPAQVDERRHRHWLIKAGTVMFALFVGGVLAVAWRAGDIPDGKVVGPIMAVVGDVAKLIFSMK